jgi:subtilase family serine protease
VIWFLLSTTSARAARTQVLHAHVPTVVAHSQPLGRFPNTNRSNLAIGLPLRNEESLTNLLREIYDPASANFRHFLKLKQ